MNISYETITILTFLIPGFLSSIILDNVISRQAKDSISKILEALVFSLLIYTVSFLITNSNQVPIEVTEISDTQSMAINFQVYNLTIVFAVALILPLIIGFFVTYDLHMRFLRAIKITHKTSRNTVWLDVFTDPKRYVTVNLSDGRRIFGWPMYYSTNQEDKMIYLSNPCWINDKGEYLSLNQHGIFLVKDENIDSIEYTIVDANNAQEEEGQDD